MKEVKKQRAIPPVLERYELKYTIPFSLIEPISDFVSVYCTMDKYSQEAEGKFYEVNSLYLDSPRFLFLRKRLEKADNRFNMRIRSYGDGTKFFIEIKQKFGSASLVRKYRALIDEKEWRNIFLETGNPLEFSDDDGLNNNKELFCRLQQTYYAEPKILSKYSRKAFISDVDDYARVTFDIGLRYQPQSRYNLTPDRDMLPYDNPTAFSANENVILELKCYTNCVPLWMIDCIKYFDLRRRSFSKYLMGMTEVFKLYRYAPSSREAAVILAS